VRDTYVRQFSAFVDGFSEYSHIVEPALRNAEGEIADEGALETPYRADYVVLETGKPKMFTPEKSVGFEPCSFSVEDTKIVIVPFAWDYASISFTGEWNGNATRALKNWFRQAFGDDDAADNTALQNAVHYVSDPQVSPSGYSFTVDFGTAPASALDDLLSALLSNTPTRIEIGQPAR
jgi:hypothetical protein